MSDTIAKKRKPSRAFERQMQRNRRLIGHSFHDIEDQCIADACDLQEIRESIDSVGGFRGFSF